MNVDLLLNTKQNFGCNDDVYFLFPSCAPYLACPRNVANERKGVRTPSLQDD